MDIIFRRATKMLHSHIKIVLSITVYVHCNVHYFDFWFPKIYAFKINGHVFPFVYPTYLCTQEAGIGKTNSSSARFFTSCEYSREFLVIQGVHQYWIYYSNYKTHKTMKNAFFSNSFMMKTCFSFREPYISNYVPKKLE